MPSQKNGIDRSSFAIGIGESTSDRRSADNVVYGFKYLYPIAKQVKVAVALDVEQSISDNGEIIVGLQIYPVKPKIYFLMGAGVLDAKGGGEVIVRGGFGYEWSFTKQWFLDAALNADYANSGTARSAFMIGIGKRF